MSDVSAKVKELIISKLGVSADQVTDNAHFRDDLGADSLDTYDLIMVLEEEFGLQIPDEDAEKLETVGKAVAYIKSKVP
jgi:acyl carrier protein